QASLAVSMTSRSTPRASRRSGDAVEAGEIGPRAALEDCRRVAISERRDEIALHIGLVCKKGCVDRGIVEARHRPRIETQRARGEDEISALQARVAKGGRLGMLRIARKPASRVGMRKEFGQKLVEFRIHRDDD